MAKKIALITGASRGLGAALSEKLSETHHIIAVARTVGGLEDLDDRIKAKNGFATLVPMDITNREAMKQLFTSIFERWGRIDLWAHTAIYAPPLSPLSTIDLEDLDKSYSTNITATALLINFISPIMRKEGHALFFEDPPNALSTFMGRFCPSITLECGLSGDELGIKRAENLLMRLLTFERKSLPSRH